MSVWEEAAKERKGKSAYDKQIKGDKHHAILHVTSFKMPMSGRYQKNRFGVYCQSKYRWKYLYWSFRVILQTEATFCLYLQK